MAALRRNIAECDFNTKCTCNQQVSVADIFLRAQFIRGIQDSWNKERILQSELMDFNDIVAKAIGLEASKADSRELSTLKTTGDYTTSTTQVNKITKHNGTSKRNNEYRQNKQRTRSKSRGRIDYERLGIKNCCLRCGRDNHLSKD